MKLRDLVANSLPRVRGRKKKTTPAPGNGAAVTSGSNGVIAGPEPTRNSTGLDKNANHFASRGESRDRMLEAQGISEASWRGNALYRGLEVKAVESTRMLASTYTSSQGVVTSRSAEGFSSQLMLMSRSYDSRMAVSDFNGSCSQMSSISESGVEPYHLTQEQHYHCHYHRHNHHHHHHHHVHSKPMSPLVQNQQEMGPNACGIVYLPNYKPEGIVKPEPGFFRKSFASFKGMRKHGYRSTKDAADKPVSTENIRCSVCPYPEASVSSTDRKQSDKRPVKPKRKGLKGFSRSKENKDVISGDKCDKTWYSDNDAQNIVSPVVPRYDAKGSITTGYERSRVRECSVESCSSRLYGGSREGSCGREVDLTGFDSASLSGYESDLPRNKVHRSRSRIKTNPWLPSPQPSLSGGRRSEQHPELRESSEDIAYIDELASRFPRSASFEYQRTGSAGLKTWKESSTINQVNIQRHRSLTPNDIKTTFSLNRSSNSPAALRASSWWCQDKIALNEFQPKGSTPTTPLNDLNTTAPKQRPTSIVSPNSEFVIIADNIEQLANNISFEYEDMLDSTLESVSVSQEDGQASIQELLTDEENGSIARKTTTGFLKSEMQVQNAYSPDSGIGGLGSSDGDETLTPGGQPDSKTEAMDCLSMPKSQKNLSMGYEDQQVLCVDLSKKPTKNSSTKLVSAKQVNKSQKSKSPFYKISFNPFTSKNHSSGHKNKKNSFEEDSSANVSESDVDNTSYTEHDHSIYSLASTKKIGSPLPKCKIDTQSSKNDKAPSLMVNERLDTPFQPSHRYFHGSGIVMGSRVSMHEHASKIKQTASLSNPGYRYSDPTDTSAKRITRPCILKTTESSSKACKNLNDIEKPISANDSLKPREEFDFPRNIPAIECVESPTENWQCDGNFSMCSSQDTVIFEQRSSTLDRNDTGACVKHENNTPELLLGNEELFVKLDDADSVSISQSTVEMTSENTSLMDCNVEKLDNEINDASFEMNDACVQTEFDEEFSRWDEVDSLASYEDNAIDPAESTRIWLLTGNMQGSADTGYSSLTRDSQILMDEDTLFLAGELEEKAASERLSYVEGSNRSSSSEKTPRNSKNFDSNFKPTLYPENPTGINSYSRGNILEPSNSLQENKILRSIPQAKVNQLFSNIELQFQEIFQQIYDQKPVQPAAEAKRNPSSSSDSTLTSSGSDGTVCDLNPLEESQTGKKTLKDAETGENKNTKSLEKSLQDNSCQGKFVHHDYVNVPAIPNNEQLKKCSNSHSQEQSAVDKLMTNGVERKMSSGHANAPSKSTGAFTNSVDKADYLEFLKDAPLRRSHLKRPLFLVPGVGPVDMSSTEQINMCFDVNTPITTTPTATKHGSSTSSPSLSPSTTHSGKKQKCKKPSHKVPEESLSQSDKAHDDTTVVTCYGFLDLPKDIPQAEVGKNSLNDNVSTLPRVSHSCLNKHDRSSLSNLKPKSPSLRSSPPSCTLTPNQIDRAPIAPDEIAELDDSTRTLAARVISLRREKDKVYRKIQEAQQDELTRKQEKMQLQRDFENHRKEALLGTLHELRDKLQEQSKKLGQQGNLHKT
ncbi:uncharacterized protein LOC131955184 [Physella acuta]|uniref:uncharacterized protein LOC131955184 n=1 Tax=Physella acuta TaxID=109671 RepID=UPI0027DD6BA6|nr:uncharacterized protein LOC131955184 [Physella acuta]XP_059175180.1 uncharacterized protein LOC131955184 [Physella acuta]